MKVNILMADGSLKMVHNVRKVSNASARVPTDRIYVWCICDHPDRPTINLPMSDVLTVEVLPEH